MPQLIEADVVIIGGGISAAMVAERVAEDTSASIAVIEAGNRIFDFENRFNTRRRFLDYGKTRTTATTSSDTTATTPSPDPCRWAASRCTGGARLPGIRRRTSG